jgi:hypothetical protein
LPAGHRYVHPVASSGPTMTLGTVPGGCIATVAVAQTSSNLHGAPLNVSWGFADSMLNTTGLGKPVS